MSRKKNRFVFFVISFFLVFKAFGAGMSAKDFFEKASIDLKNNKLSSAQLNIAKAIEIDGNNFQFYLLRAQLSAYKSDTAAISQDVENAERCDPQAYQIYAFKAGLLKGIFGRGRQYFLNLNKAQIFEQLSKSNIRLPRNVFGMLTSEFNAVPGPEGYFEANLDLSFKEIQSKEIPVAGKLVKQIFKRIDANKKGVSLLKESPSRDYEILAYRLETCFLDPSEKFYRFFYWVKYRFK